MDILAKVLFGFISLLRDKGIETPERDAMLLLNFGLNFTENQYSLNQDRLISNIEFNKIKSLIHRRANYEPVSKIIGKKLFWNSSFYVDRYVLDPRPETEILVQSVLSNVGNRKSILDLGTGTGCVAISLNLMLPGVTVSASDVSEKALKIGRWNAKKNDAKVEFILSSWFANISKKFDIIVSNPPYVSITDFDKLPVDVKTYDPKLSLVGGEDGLDCYREIVKSISSNMSNQGLAFFEIGFGQKEAIIEIFSKSGLPLVNVWKDLNGLERVICVKKDA